MIRVLFFVLLLSGSGLYAQNIDLGIIADRTEFFSSMPPRHSLMVYRDGEYMRVMAKKYIFDEKGRWINEQTYSAVWDDTKIRSTGHGGSSMTPHIWKDNQLIIPHLATGQQTVFQWDENSPLSWSGDPEGIEKSELLIRDKKGSIIEIQDKEFYEDPENFFHWREFKYEKGRLISCLHFSSRSTNKDFPQSEGSIRYYYDIQNRLSQEVIIDMFNKQTRYWYFYDTFPDLGKEFSENSIDPVIQSYLLKALSSLGIVPGNY